MTGPRSQLGGDARAIAAAAALLLAEGLLRVVAFAVAILATGAIFAIAGAVLVPDVYPYLERTAYTLAGVPTASRAAASPESLRAFAADLLTIAGWLAGGAAALYTLVLLGLRALQLGDQRGRNPGATS